MKKFIKDFFIGVGVAVVLLIGVVVFFALKKPEGLVPYSAEDMSTWLTEQMYAREEQSIRQYEPDNADAQQILDDMEAIQTELFSSDARACYEVKSMSYNVYDYTSYIEVNLTASYGDLYEDLEYMEDYAAAAEYVAEQLNNGVTENIMFRTGSGWDTDELAYVVYAACDNAAEVSSTMKSWVCYPGMEGMDTENYFTVVINYSVDAQKLQEGNKELSDAIDAMAADIKAQGITDTRELYLAIGKAVCSAADYDYDIPDLMFSDTRTDEQWMESSAYGTLVMGKTICSGYAMAFKALCDRLELPCWVVSGYNDSVAHAWNMVQIDGETFYTDCTYADGSWDNSWLMMNEDVYEARGYITSVNAVKPW